MSYVLTELRYESFSILRGVMFFVKKVSFPAKTAVPCRQNPGNELVPHTVNTRNFSGNYIQYPLVRKSILIHQVIN